MRLRPGSPYPLGAAWDGHGVNFALRSANAARVELCLFDPRGEEVERLEVAEKSGEVHHLYVAGLGPGQLYGYRVHGPYKPAHGHRFNPHKVLLDPYARAVGRAPLWSHALFGYRVGDPAGPDSFDARDDAPVAPLGMVIDERFDWGDDRAPNVPWEDTVVYEAHVKGFTKLHPQVPEALRGTYAGLATEPVIAHLKALGVTAVELLPIHHHAPDGHLVAHKLTNYWGYNTLAFFAPDPRLAMATSPQGVVHEVKHMVKALHRAGLEVWLDVVYNHTAEGNELGPTLSLKGLDNARYYRLTKDGRHYWDVSGTGNTVDSSSPAALQLILDSLRYWVSEYRIDGFRFDLATALGRDPEAFTPAARFFEMLRQDPVLSRVKLVAEPWDLGPEGYQVGGYPHGWREWNGKFRDDARRFWRGDDGFASALAARFLGSPDVYAASGRGPTASVNFVACHDGFPLGDLVTYAHKHNEANGEDNRDGENHNHSWNNGVEGPTGDPGVRALRERQKRSLLATLAFAQGVPMLGAGDELSRTQGGNNNAYCQDNAISWLNWALGPEQEALLAFTRRLFELRRRHPALRRRKFYTARPTRRHLKGLRWLTPAGQEMTAEDWTSGFVKCLGVKLAGDHLDEVDPAGEPISDDTLLVLFNAHHEAIPFHLPRLRSAPKWALLVDTARPEVPEGGIVGAAGDPYALEAHSVALWRLIPSEAPLG